MPFRVLASLVSGLTYGVLDFAGILLRIASNFFALVTGYLANPFFYGTFHFVLGAFSSILVHGRS